MLTANNAGTLLGVTRSTPNITFTVSAPMTFTAAYAVPPCSAANTCSLEVIRAGSYGTPQASTAITITRTGGSDEGIGSITANTPAGITMVASPPNSGPFGSSFASTVTFSAASSVATGDYNFNITITSALSGGTQALPFTLRVRDPVSYSLQGGPTTVYQGNARIVDIPANYASGGAETISSFSVVSITSPGSGTGGILTSFPVTSCSIPPSQSPCARLNIQTLSSTPIDTYTITVTSRSGTTNTAPTANAVFTVQVTGAYDFSIAYGTPILPCTVNNACSVEQNNSIQIAVSLTSPSPAGEAVAVSVTGTPSGASTNTVYSGPGATASSCSPYSGNPCTATITVSAGSAAPNTYYLNITGNTVSSSPPRSHSLPAYALTVTQGFTFTVSLNPTSGTAINNGNVLASSQATITLLTGSVPGAVTLSTLGALPPGVTVTFPSNNPCAPACSQLITFRAVGTTAGSYPITVRGQYGTYTVDRIFTLIVEDPFDFCIKWLASDPCSGTQTTGDITSIPGGPLNVPLTTSWAAGGSASMSYAAASPNPALLNVSVSPSGCGVVNQTTNCPATLSITANNGLPPDTYTVTVTGFSSSLSGNVSKNITIRVTVGSSFRFTLSPNPTSYRVYPKPGSAQVDITVRMTALNAGPVTLSIQNETENYTLPAGITASFTNNPCTPSPNILNATCPSAPRLTLTVDATTNDGVYNIPIFGQSGPAKVVTYFTLKVGALNLTQYRSFDLLTDPHQRPIPQFAWSPVSPFAGDDVAFNASASQVWTGSAMGGATGANATFQWSFTGLSSPTPPPVTYASSGVVTPFLTVGEPGVPSCYTSTARSAADTQTCACATSTDSLIGGGINVSKPRPFFREIKP